MQVEINFTHNNAASQAQFNENKEHYSNQCYIVLEALKRGERLTTGEALIRYQIGDLRRRIKDLIDFHQVPVKSEFFNGTRFKIYYL